MVLRNNVKLKYVINILVNIILVFSLFKLGYRKIFYFFSETAVSIMFSSFVHTIILFNGFIHGPLSGLIIGFCGTILGMHQDYWPFMVYVPWSIDFGLFGFLIGIIAFIIKTDTLKKQIIVFSASTIILYLFDYIILSVIIEKEKQISSILYKALIDRMIPILITLIIGSVLLLLYYNYTKNSSGLDLRKKLKD